MAQLKNSSSSLENRYRHLVFCVGTLTLLTSIFLCSEPLAHLFLPLLHKSLAIIVANRYNLVDLTVGVSGHDMVFQLQVKTLHNWMLENGHLPAGVLFSSSTLVAHLLVNVALAVMAAWLMVCYRTTPVLMGLLSVLLSLPVIVAFDVPMVLMGAINDLIFANLAPEKNAKDGVILTMRFLNHGGRIFLSAMLPIIVIQCLTLALPLPPPLLKISHDTSAE